METTMERWPEIKGMEKVNKNVARLKDIKETG